ncbi:hypothetical protein [Labedaea rhizosphaerae]|uniref:Uncharacterized protein n=1 Tax=Labedaea rhizosphaerae TaxID=598644 RepID=A0A4R6SBU2_LABRH|nr:hypothetical protein [Labedaea rhizosphaerae]TDP97044.1 hypothetical protein EV186_1032 [Labedaea rhizosphaerae]
MGTGAWNNFDKQKAPWPTDNAGKVHDAATKHHHQGALDMLKLIRNDLFGDADRCEELAVWWGESYYMTSCRDSVNESRENLIAYWQGGAFDSYSTYAINTTATFDRNEGALNEIAGVMTNCVGIVYDTYKMAIKFIGDCAHDLADAGIGLGEAIIFGPLAPAKAGIEVMKALNNFVHNVNNLIADAVQQMGQYRENGIFLARQANDFAGIRPVAEPVHDPSMWQVKPKAKEPAA